MINILNFDRESLKEKVISFGEKPFRANQLTQWIHQYGHSTFDDMSNLSKSFRAFLQNECVVAPPTIALEQISTDGTIKWLIKLEDGNHIESVFIPEETRGTLCISSQVGCPINCVFCSTAKMGFTRNLTVSEIIGQVWLAVRRLSKQSGFHDREISNIVLMGMGEPLLNFDAVIKSMNIMMDDFAYCISKYRLTLSTSGIVPAIDKLSEVSACSLAISLHATTNELRNQLVPINKKYPLEDLIAACKRFYSKDQKRQVSIEYIMLKDINDSASHAKQLVRLLQGLPAKVNLIPFNECANIAYKCSLPETTEAFKNILLKSGFRTITRKTRGKDINASCGQLAYLQK
jgi:23S rRNA (adenine2503-C2)-methyltransferase